MTGPDPTSRRRGHGWAWGIAATYLIFAALTLTMVFFAFRSRVELVSDDYYQRGIDHQQRIEAVARTRALPEGARWHITHADGTLLFRLPASRFTGDMEGRIHLYRPDDSRRDRDYPIVLDAAGEQRIDTGDLAPGRWRVRIEWRAGGLDYYSEHEMMIGG